MAPPFILASNSPRRRNLLEKLDIAFDIAPSNVQEDYTNDENPEDLVCLLALKKAKDVGRQYPDRVVIGADTVVVLEGKILGKPESEPQAVKMLQMLSGKTHAVFTGVALVELSKQAEFTFAERTDVSFFEVSYGMIEYYVRKYKPLDKAGAYGIQDWSACFVESISGSYDNVVGFPTSKFIQLLRTPELDKMFGPLQLVWKG